MEDSKVSVAEFEAAVLEREGIVLRIRAPSGTKVSAYSYERKAAGNQSTTDWIEGRIKPLLNGFEFCIIDGNYTQPHGRTRLDRLRDSYDKD